MTLSAFRRRSRMSWTEVGKLLGMSRQAAWGLGHGIFFPSWSRMLAIHHATSGAVTATEKDWPRPTKRRRAAA